MFDYLRGKVYTQKFYVVRKQAQQINILFFLRLLRWLLWDFLKAIFNFILEMWLGEPFISFDSDPRIIYSYTRTVTKF